MRIYEQSEVIQLLRQVQGKRNGIKFAFDLGISYSFLMKVMTGARKPSPVILAAINPKLRAQREMRTIYVETQ